MTPPKVHLPPHKAASRANAGSRAYPVTEPSMPTVTALDGPTRAKQLLGAIDWADVENSPRWLPWINKKNQALKDAGKKWRYSTACNIYASDICKLYGAYFPRVYWTDGALKQMARTGIVPAVKYGVTVHELSANALAEWMVERGHLYGWQRCHIPSTAQDVVNDGGIGLALAAKDGGIGHVSVIVPESPAQMAPRDSQGLVSAPVQSQAGARNKKLFASRWWDKTGHVGGLWVHAWTDPAELLARAAKSVLP